METKIEKRSVYESIEKAEKLGKILAQSQIFGVKNPADAAVLAITCVVENITPLDFIRKYHIIQGRPTMRADAMLAEFCRAGGRHKILKYTAQECEIEFEWKGAKKTWKWTMEDAKRAGLHGDNWRKYPKDMLFARCVSSALKKICPEIFHGLYVPEEIQDLQESEPVSYEVIQNEAQEKKEKTEETKEKKEVLSNYDFSICPIDGRDIKKGQKWEEVPRNVLFKAKKFFESGALPIRLTREERQAFSEAIQEAIDKRGDERKEEELAEFEGKLADLPINELEKLAKNNRYGLPKKQIILHHFMKEICRIELDEETKKNYKDFLSSLEPDNFKPEDKELYEMTLDVLEGLQKSEAELF